MEKKTTTSNGINIYYYKQPNTHSVCISLYVKTGVLYENENHGISHFLEHMHFRKLGGKAQKELYYQLESIGANFSACTYKEFIQFYLTSSPRYFSELTKIASGLLGKLEADVKDLKAEKRIILSEIREDDQKDDINFVSSKYIWEGTNLQNSILGSVSSVKGITLELLQEEKEKTFTRDNMFFYVTGCFDEGDISKLISEVDRYELNNRPDTQNDNNAEIPKNFKSRNAFVKVSHRKEFMHDVKISFDVDFNVVSRRNLLYLDSILSDGLCSLLRTEMIEKRGLIYSFASTIEQYNNIGVYYFIFSIHKSKLYDTLKSFIGVLKNVKKDIHEIDMQTTRVFKTDNQMEMLDSPEDLNWTFAYENHILKNSYTDISELADEYKKITKEKLVRTANEVFIADNAVLVSIGNKKGLSEIVLREVLSGL